MLPPACKVLILIGSFAKPVDGSIGSRWKRDLLQPSQLRARKSSEISIKEIENFRPLWQGWDARRLRFRERKKEWRKKIFRQEHERYINYKPNDSGINFFWSFISTFLPSSISFLRQFSITCIRIYVSTFAKLDRTKFFSHRSNVKYRWLNWNKISVFSNTQYARTYIHTYAQADNTHERWW